MQLKRREDVIVSTWINDKPISTPDWLVFGEIQEDTLYFSIQEPNTNNQLKVKIQKITNHENNQENQSENK